MYLRQATDDGIADFIITFSYPREYFKSSSASTEVVNSLIVWRPWDISKKRVRYLSGAEGFV